MARRPGNRSFWQFDLVWLQPNTPRDSKEKASILSRGESRAKAPTCRNHAPFKLQDLRNLASRRESSSPRRGSAEDLDPWTGSLLDHSACHPIGELGGSKNKTLKNSESNNMKQMKKPLWSICRKSFIVTLFIFVWSIVGAVWFFLRKWVRDLTN